MTVSEIINKSTFEGVALCARKNTACPESFLYIGAVANADSTNIWR